MTAIIKFDTLSWAKRLEKAGISSQQAEVQVELVFQAVAETTSTKQEFCEAESKIEVKLKEIELSIKEVETRLELKIEALRREILLAIEKIKGSINTQIAKWVLGVSAIQTTVLVVFMRMLH